MHDEKEPVRAGGWSALLLLSLVYTFNFLDRTLIYILFKPIREELSLGELELALLGSTSFVIFYTALGVPFGRLADRVHRVRMITVGLVVWSVFSGLTGFMHSFTGLFLCRVMVGVGEATLGPAAISLLADYFPASRRANANALYSSGVPVGAALAMFGGGAIAQAWGWRGAFFALGFPGVVLAIVLLLVIREPARGAHPPKEPQKPGPAELDEYRRAHRGRRDLWAWLAGAQAVLLLATGAWTAVTAFGAYRWSGAVVSVIAGGVALAAWAGARWARPVMLTIWPAHRLVDILLGAESGRPQVAWAQAYPGTMFAVCVLMYLSVRNRLFYGLHVDDEAVARSLVRERQSGWRSIVANPTLQLHTLGYAFFAVAANSVSMWMPSLLGARFGKDLKTIGLVMGLSTLVGGLAGSVFGGRLADAWRKRREGGRLRFSAVAALACVPLWVGLLYAPSFETAALFIPPLMAAALVWLGPAAADLAELVPVSQRGVAVGLYFLGVNVLGYGVGPPVIGYLAQLAGSKADPTKVALALHLSPVACVVAAVLLWRASLRRESADGGTPVVPPAALLAVR